MARSKLIFFVATDPAHDLGAVTAAYEFAKIAAAAGVPTEVRLAGDAVLVADPAYVATLSRSRALRGGIDEAQVEGIETSVCPGSVEARGIRDDQLIAIGARRRPLGDIFVEVADGLSVLVHL